MSPELFKKRTKAYALKIMRFTDGLPSSRATNVIAGQLLRSGTSVGANYRAACRAKSPADFISKMGTVEEECDESIFWMELLEESGKSKDAAVSELKKEGSEILAMVVASINTARIRRNNPQSAIRNPQ
ncbi:MAG: four helix bundle protein [Verrucomicrobiales bacterium]|nr:four helix bundle protein [Verrucomicrobiales bacterium]